MIDSGLIAYVYGAENNAWANDRLQAAVAQLSHAEFEAPCTGFFSSIQQALNHILIVDWSYIDALKNVGKRSGLCRDRTWHWNSRPV